MHPARQSPPPGQAQAACQLQPPRHDHREHQPLIGFHRVQGGQGGGGDDQCRGQIRNDPAPQPPGQHRDHRAQNQHAGLEHRPGGHAEYLREPALEPQQRGRVVARQTAVTVVGQNRRVREPGSGLGAERRVGVEAVVAPPRTVQGPGRRTAHPDRGRSHHQRRRIAPIAYRGPSDHHRQRPRHHREHRRQPHPGAHADGEHIEAPAQAPHHGPTDHDQHSDPPSRTPNERLRCTASATRGPPRDRASARGAVENDTGATYPGLPATCSQQPLTPTPGRCSPSNHRTSMHSAFLYCLPPKYARESAPVTARGAIAARSEVAHVRMRSRVITIGRP